MCAALNAYWRAELLGVDFFATVFFVADFFVADFFVADFFVADFFVPRFFVADFLVDLSLTDADFVDEACPCFSSSRACSARLPSPRSSAITASRS